MNFFLYIWLAVWTILILIQWDEIPTDREEWTRHIIATMVCLAMIALGIHRLYQ